MKVLPLNGSPHGRGCTFAALSEETMEKFNIRKFSAMIFSALLCVALSACGGGNASPDTVRENSDSSEEVAVSGAPEQSGIVTDTGAVETDGVPPEATVFPLGVSINAPQAFTGRVWLSQLIPYEETYNFPQTNSVSFEPGARSAWHTHGGMIILATAGTGYYQEEGKPARILQKGDVVEIPEGVKHWHGAAPDSWFSQIVIYDSQYEEGETGSPVTDEEYLHLETEEYAERNVSEDNPYMFQKAASPFTSDMFSGPVYVSQIIDGDNVAGAPELRYVVFEPGVVNNWHIHEGGQILMVTDGVGYHQTEGGEVEILRPGDVAFCPPGVKHWHGASAGSAFAHIAVNANPSLSGLEWFDRITEEEYKSLEGVSANESGASEKDLLQGGEPDTEAAFVSSADDTNGEKILIAYFAVAENSDVDAISSASVLVDDGEAKGLSKFLADIIAERTGGELFSIRTEEKFPGEYEPLANHAKEEQDNGVLPVLTSHIGNLDEYDTVFIGYPVWWYTLPQVMLSFFEEYDFSGKTLIPFCTHLGSRSGGTFERIAELESGATVKDGFFVSMEDAADAEPDVLQWLAGLGR